MLKMKTLDIQIEGRYRVVRKIGQGGFGQVYSGTELKTGDEVAIKLQPIRNNMPRLEHEVDIYQVLAGGVGIPRMHMYGDECEYYFMIHDLLGPSLEDLFNFCGRKFSLKTTLLLADQLLARIKYIHTRSIIHRDIKPDNFVMGSGKQGNLVYMIDFDLAIEYRDAESMVHIAYRDNCTFGGTSRFASINNHLGIRQSRRDDLESLGYVLLYFVRGALPWQGSKIEDDKERDEYIKGKKVDTPVEELCHGLPEEFATYLNYTRGLAFDELPDYSYLSKMLHSLFLREGFEYDNVFDWTIRKFAIMQENLERPSPS
ncbi:casein kinase i [Phlyctema vagabunda]|uniref:non-specific serine/threonine protein kinase n=1 Tax=Phlyctema vagabunda TaxID=108571 RepID=A0ABR4PAQ2_9HELO